MSDTREAWARYWKSAPDSACLPGAPGAVRAALAGVWGGFSARIAAKGDVLDIAAGAGAVVRALNEARADLAVCGVDYADVGRAAASIGIRGGVDAAALPFADASFDAVTSQFGIEYCSDAAWREAARVLRPDGALCFVCHHADSRLVAHNRSRLAAMRAMESAGLFAMALDIARGGREDVARADAIRLAREQQRGQQICAELPAALGQALRRRDAVDAVAAIAREAGAEMARLAAMSVAALDDDAAERRRLFLASVGIEVSAGVLPAPEAGPVAWVFLRQ